MTYSISQVAQKLGLTTHTLRYYDKEGLLPFVKRSSSGLRVFSETDLEWLVIIECLKGTGMQLKDIKIYIDWYIQGDETLQKRLDMFIAQKQKIATQMKQLEKHMEKIDYKIKYYQDAIKNGGSNKQKNSECINEEKKRIFAINEN